MIFLICIYVSFIGACMFRTEGTNTYSFGATDQKLTFGKFLQSQWNYNFRSLFVMLHFNVVFSGWFMQIRQSSCQSWCVHEWFLVVKGTSI